jgi:hypothetical protein
MDIFTKLFKRENIGELILSIFFIFFLFAIYDLPLFIANFVNTTFGKICICMIVIVLIIYCNAIVSLLSILVAYELIKRSMNYLNTSQNVGLQSLAQYNPKEHMYPSRFTENKQFLPFTLEEEIVQKMAPICSQNSILSPQKYIPNPENTYNSETLRQEESM